VVYGATPSGPPSVGGPRCPMLVLRDVQKTDLPGLKRLAAVLNTVNLPNNEETLEAIIDKSVKSFAGKVKNPFEREYLFVLEDARNGLLIGTSMIIAQHGTYEAPHIYYEVSEREHYSASIDRHFRHKVLSIGYNYEGPTEIGGLVVDPPYRATPDKPGKQLSYVRFLFIAMHRRLFRPKVLAELLPPLLPDGRSLLWEACGKKFTGLTYHEADRLSRQNKEFIKELFPASDVYTSLFPERVQKVLGEVGPNTKGVQRMLERVGFRYVERIDPFDGGPHFEANTGDVTLIRRYRTLKLAEEDFELEGDDVMVAVEQDSGRNRFRSVRCSARLDNQHVYLPAKAKQALDAEPGAKLSIIPFE
jgi:arginine N-succinyltransferase